MTPDTDPVQRRARVDARLSALSAEAREPIDPALADLVRGTVLVAAVLLDRTPGLYLDEDECVEARWHFSRGASAGEAEDLVVSATFAAVGLPVEAYAYDRQSESVVLSRDLHPRGPEHLGRELNSFVRDALALVHMVV